MISLFLSIPHILPKIEICCCDKRIMEYLYHLYTPYISFQKEESEDYCRLHFYKNVHGELIVEGNGLNESLNESIFAYLQKFLLQNLYAEDGFLLLHGGSVAYKNKAYVFLANSMVGKSTLVTHLCMNGFEYITDDRILLNTNTLEIYPFTKTIMLRPGGKELLIKQYGHRIITTSYIHKKMHKEFFKPTICRKEKTKIAGIFVLNRKSEGKLERKVIEGPKKIVELLKFSLSVRDCKKIHEFLKLFDIRMEVINFFDLNEILNLIEGTEL